MKIGGFLAVLLATFCLIASGCASLSGSDWRLVDLNGRPLGSDAPITIHFEDGKINGFDGCNRYSASCRMRCGKLKLDSDIASTMMACPEPVMRQAAAFIDSLKAAVEYRVDGRRLVLLDAGGKSVATFMEQNNDLTETTWIATSINNGKQAVVSPISGSTLTAEFSADGRVSGSAGCNNYIASFEVSGEKLKIGPAASTRMVCADPQGLMEQEALFLRALEKAQTYRIEGNQLELRKADGALAVKLYRSRDSR